MKKTQKIARWQADCFNSQVPRGALFPQPCRSRSSLFPSNTGTLEMSQASWQSCKPFCSCDNWSSKATCWEEYPVCAGTLGGVSISKQKDTNTRLRKTIEIEDGYPSISTNEPHHIPGRYPFDIIQPVHSLSNCSNWSYIPLSFVFH